MSARELRTPTPDWGISFPRPVSTMGGLPIRELPLAKRLLVPLQQNIGAAPELLVKRGDTVLKGQPLARPAAGQLSAMVHAPSSGIVRDILLHPVPGANRALCCQIECDGDDTRWPGYTATDDWLTRQPSELLELVQESGTVGLGGALFPTAAKLSGEQPVHTLILNGVECEPRINCDDALMRCQPHQIILGARILMHILDARECYIALKADTPAAVSSLRLALADEQNDRIKLALIPPVYPAGGEAQLIELISGTEIPSGGLPRDIGVICQNVATAAAVANFFTTGEPLVSRVVTVAGSGIADPVNVLARGGTPIKELLEFAGGPTSDTPQIVMGGPMMGIDLPELSTPVTKACNCLYVRPEAMPEPSAMPCIRCDDCTPVCPAGLMPQLLLLASRTNDFERLGQLGIADCIECGCCDYVCPSHIELTRLFTAAKQTSARLASEQQRAARAEARYESRQQRLAETAARQQQEQESQDASLEALQSDPQAAIKDVLNRVAKKDGPGQ